MRRDLLRTCGRENDGGDEPLIIEQPDDNWCTCENCVPIPNIPERLRCQSTSEIIGGKIDNKKCISLTDAFHDVCLNKNVLEAALGTWREFTDEEFYCLPAVHILDFWMARERCTKSYTILCCE